MGRAWRGLKTMQNVFMKKLWKRREVVRVLGAAGLGALSPVGRLRAEESPEDFYRKAVVIDGNCLLPTDEDGSLPPEIIAMIRGSGLTAIKASIGGFDSPIEETNREIGMYEKCIATHPDLLMQVKSYGDILTAKKTGRLGVIFSFEEVAVFDGKLERIDLFADKGVRVMQLSYNLPSVFASGVLSPQPSEGLTPLGREAVARMEAQGVTVDMSHLDGPSTLEVLEVATKPVLITHAGCTAVHPHPRNKSDDELRRLARNGGVIGIYDLCYLTASPHQPNLNDYFQHLDHALKVCGEEHVGIGSDQAVCPFDTSPEAMADYNKHEEERHRKGVAAPEEDRPLYVEGLNRADRTRVIAEEMLKRGYGERVTAKVLGENFARVFQETWKA